MKYSRKKTDVEGNLKLQSRARSVSDQSSSIALPPKAVNSYEYSNYYNKAVIACPKTNKKQDDTNDDTPPAIIATIRKCCPAVQFGLDGTS